ncbi:MAG: 4-hydroxy-tetrahydrodipicolinate reductase [Methanobacteriota archaeon]
MIIKVAVCGAAGRMGRLVVRQVEMQDDMKVVAAIDSPGNPMIGKDAGLFAGVRKLGVKIESSNKLDEILRSSKPKILMDFTVAKSSVKNVKAASKAGVAVVVGTTGFTPRQRREMEEAIQEGKIRAIISPNFSVGVNVFFKVAREAVRLLGKDYEPGIEEIHHIHKRDAPSGTALKVAEIISEELGIDREKIRIKSLREGEVVGEHTLIFSNPYEQLDIMHRARSRETFATGAVKAARYILKKGKPGVIKDMHDLLGF